MNFTNVPIHYSVEKDFLSNERKKNLFHSFKDKLSSVFAKPLFIGGTELILPENTSKPSYDLLVKAGFVVKRVPDRIHKLLVENSDSLNSILFKENSLGEFSKRDSENSNNKKLKTDAAESNTSFIRKENYLQYADFGQQGDLFEVVVRGKKKIVTLNTSHPFTKALRNLNVEREKEEEIASLVSKLFVAFFIARNCYEDEEDLLNNLELSWGMELQSTMKEGRS